MLTLDATDTAWVITMFVISLVMIVVNERYSTGVPKSWLWFQIVTWSFGTWMVRQPGPLLIMLLPLILSASAGLVGFTFLLMDDGHQRFTKPIFPGAKTSLED